MTITLILAVKLSVALFVFGAASDEILSVGMYEIGGVFGPQSTATRLTIKGAMLPVYLVIVNKAENSNHKKFRILGKIVQFGVPAVFTGAAISNIRRGKQ